MVDKIESYGSSRKEKSGVHFFNIRLLKTHSDENRVICVVNKLLGHFSDN